MGRPRRSPTGRWRLDVYKRYYAILGYTLNTSKTRHAASNLTPPGATSYLTLPPLLLSRHRTIPSPLGPHGGSVGCLGGASRGSGDPAGPPLAPAQQPRLCAFMRRVGGDMAREGRSARGRGRREGRRRERVIRGWATGCEAKDRRKAHEAWRFCVCTKRISEQAAEDASVRLSCCQPLMNPCYLATRRQYGVEHAGACWLRDAEEQRGPPAVLIVTNLCGFP